MRSYLFEVESVEHFDNLFGPEVNNDKLYFLDIFATWCGPCKKLLPMVEAVAAEMAEKDITFYKVNVDNTDLLNVVKSKYEVTSIPTLLFIRNGEVLSRHGNPGSKDALVLIIEEALNN